ncbi:Hypothetical predicted protein [Cloeon dipterum]|uniref:Uncharacterized protein n=1 Tax=Cloeon dipterum TaxID=197152 RepID=A0A8S1DI79_9INSE|nr:Hypothetical predicted protein [Cloeon dipterum]
MGSSEEAQFKRSAVGELVRLAHALQQVVIGHARNKFIARIRSFICWAGSCQSVVLTEIQSGRIFDRVHANLFSYTWYCAPELGKNELRQAEEGVKIHQESAGRRRGEEEAE